MSPLRLAYPGGTVEIVVHFAGKLGPQGKPEGNVTRIELWVNGVLVDTIQNPPNVKSGTVTFHLDLSAYGEGEIMLSAVAYQGNGKSAPSGASAAKAVGVDLTDPTGTITIPTEGALVPSARPMVRADYADPPGAGGYRSGIDRSSVRLYNEHGTDVTGDAEVGDAFLLYTPAPERALADGPHELRLHVVDFAGRTFETTRHFTTDTIPPGLTLETPGAGASLFATDLAFAFSATDANGVALVSATVDGTDITQRFVRDGDRFTYTPHAGDTVVADLGLHTWRVVAADAAGNPAERSLTYTIVETPGGGGAPPPAYHLYILDGDGQTGVIGRCVEGPQIPGTQRTEPGRILKVRAVDDHAGGAIVSGVPLGFNSAGFLAPAPGFSTVTNSEGVAAVQCILSRAEGDNIVTVGVIGDPTAIGVTFHETAVKPTLYTTLGMSAEPGFAGRTLLAKGGNGWVFATLTRPGDPGQPPIAISASMRLDVSKVVGGVATPAGESDMYVNPRSRMTTEHGAATFILIPEFLTDTQWQAKLSIPDFPEVKPPPVSFASSGTFSAGDVIEIPELFTTQGGITTAGHPATLTVDVAPMVAHIPALAVRAALGWVVTDCALTVFGHATDENGLTLYRFTDVDGGSGTPTDGEWNDHHPDTHFALNVQPNVGSVGAFPWLMTASMRVVLVEPFTGAVAVGLYHERLVVGAPDVELVKKRPDGSFVGTNRIKTHSLSEMVDANGAVVAHVDPAGEFFVESRTVDLGESKSVELHAIDVCGESIPSGIAHSNRTLDAAKVVSTDRYVLYRSGAVISTDANLSTPLETAEPIDALSGGQAIVQGIALGSLSALGSRSDGKQAGIWIYHGTSQFVDLLDEWPANTGSLRSPKWLLGDKTNLRFLLLPDESDDPTSIESRSITLTTPSSGSTFTLTLDETGAATNIFTLPAGREVKVTTGPAADDASKLTLSVSDEEELSASFGSPGHSFLTQKVLIDVAEVGAEWQSDYEKYSTEGRSLPSCATTGPDFVKGLSEPRPPAGNGFGYGFSVIFNNGELAADAGHWKPSAGKTYVDVADYLYFSGHTKDVRQPFTGNAIMFFQDAVPDTPEAPLHVLAVEMELGKADCEVAVFDTCCFVGASGSAWASTSSRLHAVLGFWGEAPGSTVGMSKKFVELLNSNDPDTGARRSIREAWFEAAKEIIGTSPRAAAAYPTAWKNELPGVAGLSVLPDPAPSQSWTLEKSQ